MPPETAPVSVVIPAYRARATIGRALASVAAQTLRPHEAIVVDDGSDDGTVDAARAMAPELAGIELKVIGQANRGAGAARNRAIAEAGQPLLAFLDADDEWLPEKLERSLAHMAKGDYVLVAHNGWIVEDGEAILNDCARRFREGPDPFVTLYRKGYLDTCTVVARRTAVIAAGGFDETLANAQDFELWLAMLAPPDARFVVFDEALSRYHVTPGGIMSHTRRRLDCCLEIAGRHARHLRGRPGSALAGLWYRVAAVHREAVHAHWRNGNVFALVGTVAGLPWRIPSMTLAFLLRRQPERRRFLAPPAVPSGDR